MRQLGLLCIMFLCAFILTSCGCGTKKCRQALAQDSLLKETWLNQVNLDPGVWTRGADHWFLTGEPNRVEQYDLHASPSNAITSMKVTVPNFVDINTAGGYQVQIVGHQDKNTLNILGPNSATRLVAVDNVNGTIYIRQIKDCDNTRKCQAPLKKVIVRIGVRNLRTLINKGTGSVYGRDISSDGLSITSYGCGTIMLVGEMNVNSIRQTGSAKVTVIGATSPSVSIKATGNGTVNLSGRVGIQNIVNNGNGNVNIIGADSDSLEISASGASKTAVAGYANLKRVTAINSSRVYVYWVNGNGTYVVERDKARVGLAGATRNLNVDLRDSSRFEGQFLRGDNVYVRTQNSSHANVAGDKKLFANAGENSSIYFFGSPSVVSSFTTGNGLVIPVWTGINPPLMRPQPQSQPWNSPSRFSYK